MQWPTEMIERKTRVDKVKKVTVGALVALVFLGVFAGTNPDVMRYLKEVTFESTVLFKSSDGGTANIKSNCVTEAVDSGAGTQAITSVIPARAMTLGVTCRVDTVIVGAGATTFSLGDGTDADLYGAGIAFAAGTTVSTSNYTAKPINQAFSTSAANLTMTANAGQFDSGSITCCAHYVDFTAPTS